jgi:hypothetical protein
MDGAEGRSVNVNIFDSVKAFAGGRDLDEVAAEAVESITDNELLEIQSLRRPPATIQRVLEATFMLLDAANYPNPKPLQDWLDVKTRIVQVGFLSSIKSYDVEVLRSKPYLVMFILSEYFDGENALTFERTRYANHATASLFKWCVATLVQASKEVIFDEEEEVADDSKSTEADSGSSQPKRIRRKSHWRAPLSAVLAFGDLPPGTLSQDKSASAKPAGRGWRSPLTALLAFRGLSKNEEELPSQEDIGTDDEKTYPSSRGIMCCGCFLLPLVLVLLLWNERNVVCQSYSTMKVEENAIVADCSDAASVEGKLVFFSCPITQNSLHPMTPLTSFNIPGLRESIKIPAVAASQRIEMYQCIEAPEEMETITVSSGSGIISVLELGHEEHEDLSPEDAGNTTRAIVRRANRKRIWASHADNLIPGSFEEFRKADLNKSVEQASVHTMGSQRWYKMAWADVWYNSSEFKATPQHIQQTGCPGFIINGQVINNPSLPDRGDGHPIDLGKQVVYASSIVAGAFTFHDDERIKSFATDKQVELAPFASQFGLNRSTDNFVEAISLNTVAPHDSTPNFLSSGSSERLGCIRISYNESSASHITSIGLAGASGVMLPFTIEAPWGCGKDSFLRLWSEQLSFDDAMKRLKEENKAITWIIRIVGLFMACLAICCVFNPFAVFADYIGEVLEDVPVLDELFDITLEGVTAKLYCIISCSLGCSCGLLVIAVVWLAIRPITGGPVLAASVILLGIAMFAIRSHYDTMSMLKRKQKQLAAFPAKTQQRQPLMDEDEKKSSENDKALASAQKQPWENGDEKKSSANEKALASTQEQPLMDEDEKKLSEDEQQSF